MVTQNEIELLAGILQRAPVSQIEALFLNSVLERLRAMCAGEHIEESGSEPLDTSKKV